MTSDPPLVELYKVVRRNFDFRKETLEKVFPICGHRPGVTKESTAKDPKFKKELDKVRHRIHDAYVRVGEPLRKRRSSKEETTDAAVNALIDEMTEEDIGVFIEVISGRAHTFRYPSEDSAEEKSASGAGEEPKKEEARSESDDENRRAEAANREIAEMTVETGDITE